VAAIYAHEELMKLPFTLIGSGDDSAIAAEAEQLENEGEDAVIEVGMSLDPVSEDVLETVKRAAARLRSEYGVNVVVVPRLEYWGYSSLDLGFSDYPRIRVNGQLVASGEVSEEELIDAVLALLWSYGELDAAPDASIPRSRVHAAPVEAGA